MPATSGPATVPINFLRVFARSLRDLCSINFDIVVGFSVGWFSHMVLTPFSGKSFCIVPSLVPPLVESLREDVLDSMDSHCHVRRRQARDLSNRCGVHLFEIRNNDLAIERFEPQNQL
jgi:hypothetical protein